MTVKDVLELEEVKDVLQDFGEVLIFYGNKVYEIIISPLADLFIKILDFISD